MRATFLGLLVLPALALSAAAAAQPAVHYEIAFPGARHHEAEITATFTGLPRGRPLEARMSRTSPGRYALHEFAKNVYGVRADDGQGRPLAVTRPDLHGWSVEGHTGTVRIRYTLFGDRTDGTYTGIDASHAHLNMPATFLWARGMDQAPVRIAFAVPEGWSVATQLAPTAEPHVFTAPNLAYFMDSPAELGPLAWRTWEVPGPGRPYTLRLAVHHLGSDAQVDSFAAMAGRVVAEQIALFGEAPPFDFGTYTFIADYLPWAAGDGMEHRNSTILTGPRPLSGEPMLRNLYTLSHEFFHAWNVERIRPASLEPFDFEEARMSGELWFAEGFTSYYDDLFVRRAGLLTDEEYARGLSATVSTTLNAPGRRFFSPVEMSQQAPFVDAAVSVDPVNRQNTFLSYYTWGAAIGLGLDLTLRTRFSGVTLDDYLREVWRQHGRPQTPALAPARPYTRADLQRILGEVTGDPGFAAEFFARYVEGREMVDYEALLGRAGLLLRKAAPGRPWLGAPLEPAEGAARVAGVPVVTGSLHGAGISRGDRILSAAGRPTPDPAALAAVLTPLRAGESVELEVEQRGRRLQVRMVLREDPELEVVTHESAGLPVTPAMRALRGRWLASRAGR